jgi:hypothetical protein
MGVTVNFLAQTRFWTCDEKSYEALFTALSEPSVSPDDPRTLNKVASLTM